MKEERIGLFGGTFNPVHSGHLKAAEVVQKKFSLDRVLFIPSYIPPHKESSEIAPPSHRLKMIELAVASFPRFIPSSIEIEEKGKSYSIITLNKIKKLYPNSQIFFILGVDAFLEIYTWKDYEEVLEKCVFVVISRPGYRLNQAKELLGDRYRQEICELTQSGEIAEKNLLTFKIFLLQIDALNIASTDVRKRIKTGDSINGFVSEAVKTYVKKNKLYQ